VPITAEIASLRSHPADRKKPTEENIRKPAQIEKFKKKKIIIFFLQTTKMLITNLGEGKTTRYKSHLQ
jgi:hypothetical protein